ncbi:MAG: hypothetical protein ACOYUZ_01805 [Patescibacteria group bacterium]
MNIYAIVFIGIFAALGTVVLIFILQQRKMKLSPVQKQEIKDLIKQGIVYEDDFINTYYTMLRNQGYMHLFGGYEKQAHDLLFTMIQESKGHKASLENILKNL